MDATLIKHEGQSIIVSAVMNGVEYRKIVPASTFKDGLITEEDFEAGIDYGLPLSNIVKPFIHSPEQLAQLVVNALHNAGLWTEEDFGNIPRIIGALQLVYRADAAAIQAAVREYATSHKKEDYSKIITPKVRKLKAK